MTTTATKPQRIQLRRTKGWRLQEVSLSLNGLPAVKVDRSTKWGNPYRVEHANANSTSEARAVVVRTYRFWLLHNEVGKRIADAARRELRGKNLACSCPLDGAPCHADVLIELANPEAAR